MFPEYRELISQLKHQDRHFQQLFDRHNALDQQIQNIEKHILPGTPTNQRRSISAAPRSHAQVLRQLVRAQQVAGPTRQHHLTFLQDHCAF